MQNILLRHVTGSKSGQVERFILGDFDEVTIGRDPSSAVCYDSPGDAHVGRHHAKISRESAQSDQFCITDLASRNGTFVNHQQISGTARIFPGDIIQFGRSGPAFQFDAELGERSATAETGQPTMESLNPFPHLQPPPPAYAETKAAEPPPGDSPEPPDRPVGRNTIEQLLKKTQSETRRTLYVVAGVSLALIAVLAGLLLYQGGYLKRWLAGGSAPAGDSRAPIDVNAATAAANAEAAADPERAAWRLPVQPYRVLGSGQPGKADADFDKPGGLTFTPAGLLLATDVSNRRVQIWNVVSGARLGEFGHRVLGGEIADIAVAPDGTVLITDQVLDLAYAFAPPVPGEVDETGKALGPNDYQFKGTRFGEQGFSRLGGIAFDSRGRIFVVDADRNEVRRFNPDYTLDRSWQFERAKPGGDTHLHGCDGIAIDEGAGNLYVASEKDAVVQVFDSETGVYRRQIIGAGRDASGAPSGKSVFAGSVAGLTLAQQHLLAVDGIAGHIQIFDPSRPDATNTDLADYAPSLPGRSAAYKGFFGYGPLVNFADKNDVAVQTRLSEGAIIPGQANPPGYFCSPDAIASYTDSADGETYLAIADQCNYRIVIYRWSDILGAISSTGGVADKPDTNDTDSKTPDGNRNVLPVTPPPAKAAARAAKPPPRRQPRVTPVRRVRTVVRRTDKNDREESSKEKSSGKKSKKQKQ